MNINEIQDLIKFVSKSGVSEVEIEQKDFRITIKSDGTAKRKGKKGGKNEEEENFQAFMHPGQMPYGMPPMPPMPQQQPAQPAPPQQQPAQQPPQQQEQQAQQPAQKPESGDKEGEAQEDAKYVTVKSPMIGTFYRSPSPDKPPFVNVGDKVNEGDVLCIIEAMKLFNEIEAEVSGKVVKVLVDDSSPIEYDQPLFLIDPS